jgi:hypothetical protein
MVMGYAHRHLFHSKNICPLLFGTCFIQKIYAPPLLFLTCEVETLLRSGDFIGDIKYSCQNQSKCFKMVTWLPVDPLVMSVEKSKRDQLWVTDDGITTGTCFIQNIYAPQNITHKLMIEQHQHHENHVILIGTFQRSEDWPSGGEGRVIGAWSAIWVTDDGIMLIQNVPTYVWTRHVVLLGTDHLTCRGGGVMVIVIRHQTCLFIF